MGVLRTSVKRASVRAAGLGDDGRDALGGEPGMGGPTTSRRDPLERRPACAEDDLGPRHGRQRRDYRLTRRHIVDVGGREVRDPWETARVGDEVVPSCGDSVGFGPVLSPAQRGEALSITSSVGRVARADSARRAARQRRRIVRIVLTACC